MNIVLDEDIHRSLREVFEKLGYQVKDIRDFGLRGASDDEVFIFSQKQRAILVSQDLGFANILHYPPKSHFGIIILRFPNELSTSTINKRVSEILEKVKLEKLERSITIITPQGLRRRH